VIRFFNWGLKSRLGSQAQPVGIDPKAEAAGNDPAAFLIRGTANDAPAVSPCLELALRDMLRRDTMVVAKGAKRKSAGREFG
jgi:hypothetical protein